MSPAREQATYILPIHSNDTRHLRELTEYLRRISRHIAILVVDNSPESVFSAHASAFGTFAVHCRPSPAHHGLNGKVVNVLTGLELCGTERLVVADDDVRYDEHSLAAVLRGLDVADVVRPQNYFDPSPWHAVTDTSRILINRALDGDWPGTLAFRKSALAPGYDADALFENLEAVRTVCARGGSESVRRDIYVRRLPPTVSHFWSQRVRQAYDEFARPIRLLIALSILPICTAGLLRGSWTPAISVAAMSIVLAAIGYGRDAGYRYFPWLAIATAPIWVFERALCSWLAVYSRIRFGGVRYAGRVMTAAASRRKDLEQRCTA